MLKKQKLSNNKTKYEQNKERKPHTLNSTKQNVSVPCQGREKYNRTKTRTKIKQSRMKVH